MDRERKGLEMIRSSLKNLNLVFFTVFVTLFSVSLSIVSSPADAASKGYTPPYAEMVVDVTTGKTLYQVNPDAPRHPASITKVMTLYLLFEKLERGKLSLNSQLSVSANAQRQAPSKLGLTAGDTISVENAIKALVTKSANDVAVTVAENLGGTEANFAALMTQKARSLGMSRTVYANASGLPNARQTTTARDLVRLGKAIQDRFPQYYGYFSTESFTYEGAVIGNHNKLLGRVDGVDGIKTGYTNRSGFNLLTSVKDNDRRIIAVILGGRTGASRDRRMEALVDGYLMAAAPISGKPSQVAQKAPKSPIAVTKSAQISKSAEVNQGEGDTSENDDESLAVPQPSVKQSVPKAPIFSNSQTSGVKTKLAWVVSKKPVAPAKTWLVQIGTADSERKAKALLDRAKEKIGKSLSDNNASTEKAIVANRTVWRARFANFTELDAQSTCKSLKKSGIQCFVTRG